MADRSSSGVRNIRAMFEARGDAEPPSRSRSPAGSEFSEHSRPRSKVRASFVSVEGKSGQTGSRSKDMDGTASDGGDAGQRLSITSDPRSGDANGTAIGRSPSLGRVHEEDMAKDSAAGGGDAFQSGSKDKPAPIDATAELKDRGSPKKSPSKSKAGASPSKASPVKEAARAVGNKASELKSKVEAKAASVKPSGASNKSSSKPGTAPTSTKPAKPTTIPKDSAKAATSTSSTKVGASKTTTLPSRTSRLSTASTKAATGPSKPTTASRPSATTARLDAPKKEGNASVGGFVKPPPRSPTRPVQLPAGAKASTASSSAKTGRQSLAGESSSRTSGVGVARTSSTKASTASSLATSRASLTGNPKAPTTASTKRVSSVGDAARKVSGPTSSRSSGVGAAAKVSAPSQATTTKPSTARSGVTRPAATKPTTTTSSLSKPTSSKPTTTAPALSKSAGTKPTITKPAANKPTATKPVAPKTAGPKPTATKQSSKQVAEKATTPKAASSATPANMNEDPVGTKPGVAMAMGAKAAADRVVHAEAAASKADEDPSIANATELEPPVGEPPLAPATQEAIAPAIAAEPEHGGEIEKSPEPPAHTPEVEGSLPERKPSHSEATDFAQTNRPDPVEGLVALSENPAKEPSENSIPPIEPAADVAPAKALASPALEAKAAPQDEPKVQDKPEEAPAVVPPSEPTPPPAPETGNAIAAEKSLQAKPSDIKVDTIVDVPPAGAALSPPDSAVVEALSEAAPKPRGRAPKIDIVKRQAAELEMAANELAQIDSAAPAIAPELAQKPPQEPPLQKKPSNSSARSTGSRPGLIRALSKDLHLPEAAKPSQPTEEEIADHRRQSVAVEELHQANKPQLPTAQESVPEEAVEVEEKKAVDDGKKEAGDDLLLDL